MKAAARRTLLLLALFALAAIGSVHPPIAQAAVGINVDSTADTTTAGDGDCTLREAINNANSNIDTTGGDCSAGIAGAETITFSVNGTITLGSSLPGINDDVTIDGAGQTITVDGASTYQILVVNSGKEVTLKVLTLTNGSAIGSPLSGGAIENNGTLHVTDSTLSNNTAAYGGAIWNNGGILTIATSTLYGNSAVTGGAIWNDGGTLEVTDSSFTTNQAITPVGSGGAIISNGGNVIIRNSTFSDNSASSGTGATGGAIHTGTSPVTVTNSTFSNNRVDLGNGGAIYSDGTLNVTNSTFSDNKVTLSGSGGGIYISTGSATLRNTIVAGSTGGDCFGGVLTADPVNLDSDGSCDSATQKTVAQINLAALANNGGPTETMKLQSPSAALNTGDNTVCGNAVGSPNYGAGGLDQRGVIRPQNTNCDVGAYELLFCSPGFFDNGSATCEPAAPGKFVPVAGATTATDCALGTYQDLEGQTECKQADAGSYVPFLGSIEQYTCPSGSNSAAGASVCFQTGPGFVVNDASDTDDTACDASPGDCTLREAINAANALAGADTITFDILDTGAACSSNNVCTITLGSQLPNIADEVTIDGAPNSGDITVDGASTYRVLIVNSGKKLTVNALTIANGRVSDAGGGVFNSGTLDVTNSTFSGNSSINGAGIALGGGIYNNSGTVNVTNSTFSGNSVTSADISGGGGGIYTNSGTLTVTNSTFTGNTSNTFGGGIVNAGTLSVTNSTFSGNGASGINGGGGIFNFSGRTLTVTNSTFSGNSAPGSSGGGGIRNDGTLNVTNSTFSGNSANVGGGISNTNVGTTTLRNSIIANSTSGGDCYIQFGGLTADAFNLDTDGSCNNATQNTTAEIALGALASNGGPTQTMALGNSSAAIDAGDSSVCDDNPGPNNLDQRGQARNDLNCDTGAFELKLSDTDTVVKSVAGAGAFTFGPTLAKIEVMDTGGCLTGLTVERTEANHPNAGNANLQTGHYWTITPTGCMSGFLADLTLPAVGFTPDASDKLCRYTGSGWDCAASSFDGAGKTITRGVVGQFSDWTVGNNVGPNAVTMQGFAAASGSGGSGALVALVMLGLGGLGLGAGLRRRGNKENRGQRTEDGSKARHGGEPGKLAAGYVAPAIVHRGTLKHFAGSPLGIDPLDLSR